jgi:hypothetical protein
MAMGKNGDGQNLFVVYYQIVAGFNPELLT